MVNSKLDQHVQKLEAMLVDQLSLHQQLQAVLRQKRDALRGARREEIDQCCRAENGFVQKISELEKQRLNLVADITLILQPDAKGPMKLGDLAAVLPEPSRGKLLVLRQQLFDLMQQVREEASSVRRATEAVSRHMQGLMQTVAAAINGAGSYGASGAAPQSSMKMSTFSMTA